MTLEIRLVLPARVLLDGLLRARGLRLRRRHAPPRPRQERARPQDDVRVDRPALGRERGLARDRGWQRRSRPSRSGTRRCSRASTSPCFSSSRFLIVRVLSFEWRGKAESPAWKAAWAWLNTTASFGARSSGASRSRACSTASRSPRIRRSPAASATCSACTPSSPGSRSASSSPSTARSSSRCARSASSGSARSARHHASPRRLPSSARASSSGRSSSRTT